MKLSFIGFFCCILMSGCPVMDELNDDPEPDSKIIFNNNSAIDILFSTSVSYPDTSLSKNTTFFSSTRIDSTFVKAFSSREFSGQYRSLFDYKPSNFKLMIFLFDRKIVETTPWDTAGKNYLVLKRYELSLQDLEAINWKITYP